jgi:hypothetical protein
MIVMTDPPKIDHLLPNLSFPMGMKDKERMAPRE